MKFLEYISDSNENNLFDNEYYIRYCYIYQAVKKSLEILGAYFDLSCVQIASLSVEVDFHQSDINQWWGI